ncbi:MAG: ferric reductase-like transmembrane domain-containing protein [Proteobacteria bacterium]|nr:ferric reductase-like transmembrane domain-containing protein [Pseudomonadota bacterium]MBU1056753.1 ferric reductase-like transmembrane domain-containing protein [Pseudomonadota bacterium]
MKKQTGTRGILSLAVLFIGLPLFFYATGNFPKRTMLKESISILTILAFCLMLAQFFLTRNKCIVLAGDSRLGFNAIHKGLGYVLLIVLLSHPFLIVVPRHFESGVDPKEAFVAIITSFNSLGVVLGICSWLLMLILGVTSLLRKKLPLAYKNWRMFHGILAVLFTILVCWHAIELGRHTTPIISSYIVLAAVSGVIPLLETYISRPRLEQRVNK